MLLVGREIKIGRRDVVCRDCNWEGIGNNLLVGLIRIDSASIYLVAYHCPKCSSFDVAYKGKLLKFPLLQINDCKIRDHPKHDKVK
jgi:hypothetical protein